MLDSVSLAQAPARPPLGVKANRPPLAVEADRPSDGSTPASAFTAFVDALTGPDRDDRSESATHDAGGDRAKGDKDKDRDDQSTAGTQTLTSDAQAMSPPPPPPGGLPGSRTGAAAIAGDAAAKDAAKDLAAKAALDRVTLTRALLNAGASMRTGVETDVTEISEAANGAAAGTSRATLAAAAIAAELGVHLDPATAGSNAGSTGDSPANANPKDAGTDGGKSAAAAAAALRIGDRNAERTPSNIAQAIENSVAAAAGSGGQHIEAAALRALAVNTGVAVAPSLDLGGAHGLLTSAASGTLTAADLPGADAGLQIIQAMRLQWSGGVSEARIDLEPEHLGEVSIALRVEQGQVVARMQAEVPAVREWLQTNQGWLRQSLADQGLTLSRLEVTEPSSKSHHDDRRQSSREGRDDAPARKPRQPSPGETFEVVA